MEQNILELKNIKKSFTSEAVVLDGINLTVQQGEFITLLGASGCGKTTTLRIIAGLESPDAGEILLEGREVTNLEPNKRNVNTVFQNYALFPHMNVADNIGYGLKLKKIPRAVIRQKVLDMLELVQLSGYGKRKPYELSGGQKQRVAIARALVNEPKILLLDEPLGALDANLRRDMQSELKKLQKRLNLTFIYITHDQEEAINMSDRIVVMKDGKLEQIGTPEEIYFAPKTSYVASFVGNANIFRGIATGLEKDRVLVDVLGSSVWIADRGCKIAIGDEISFAVRSEDIKIREVGQTGLPGVVLESVFTGGQQRIKLEALDGTVLTMIRQGVDWTIKEGQKTMFLWPYEKAILVDRRQLCDGEKGE